MKLRWIMDVSTLLAVCLWLSGCDKPQPAKPTALAESGVPHGEPPQEVRLKPGPPPVEATIREDGWLQRELEKERVLQSLRDYAAQAAPDDPFALSEEAIKELSQQERLEFQ